MDIRTFLCREAAAITDTSLHKLPKAADWPAERARRKAIYLDRMGLTPYLQAPRTPLNVRVTGTLERKGYRIEKLMFESLPRLYVTANLYVPSSLKRPAPAVVYFCGHSPTQKIHYQSHPRRWAQLGFVTLIVDTVQLGEIRGEHHGTYSQGRFHWISRGYSPAGVECWNGIRALDLLAQRPDVDTERMGITGISGGGAVSWWVGAADERAKIVAPVCGTGTMRSHVSERTVDGHCDCMFHINPDGWDLADVGALIAPRPLLIASADRDSIYKIDAAQETYEKLHRLYRLLRAGSQIQFIPTPGHHSYHKRSRTSIFSLFLKELAGRDIEPESVGDLDVSQDEEDDNILRVFVPGTSVAIPADERTSVIDDDFIPYPILGQMTDQAALAQRKTLVIAGLREYAFHQFPQSESPLNLEIKQHFATQLTTGVQFEFSGERDWRLSGTYSRRLEWATPHGVVISLRSPGEARWSGEEFVGHSGDRFGIAHVQTRGCGEIGWSEELAWHVRRTSAIMGRTVASMRVYDTLRAIRAVRELEGVDPKRVILAARGEMTVVALCAALLDGEIKAVAVQDPPATLNQASQPDGRGPAIELLGALRITDLAEIAALLWPADLIFVGWRPERYRFTEQTYQRLGAPGAVWHLKHLDAFQPQ